MSSQLDKLVEAITELVVQELQSQDQPTVPQAEKSARPGSGSGSKILVAPGPSEVEPALWQSLTAQEGLRFSALVWNGFRKDQLPAECSAWGLETRTTGWSKVVSGYRAVCLLGADLSVLSSVAHLGAGTLPPAGVAVAAVASGVPVFIDERQFEQLRRHSARLPGGFVRRFEETWRTVASFGVEFGGTGALTAFLQQLGESGPVAGGAPRSRGRDVVTVEDVEAVRRAQGKVLSVAVGSIVTPLAHQRAREWEIEVKFQ